MKQVTITKIEKHLDDFSFGFAIGEKDWESIPEDKSIDEAAKELGCNPDLLNLIKFNFDFLKELLNEDLEDLFKFLAMR